jgi:hypothetical protein
MVNPKMRTVPMFCIFMGQSRKCDWQVKTLGSMEPDMIQSMQRKKLLRFCDDDMRKNKGLKGRELI